MSKEIDTYERIVEDSKGPFEIHVRSIRPEGNYFAVQIDIKNVSDSISHPMITKAFYVTKSKHQFTGNAVGMFSADKDEMFAVGELLPGLIKKQEFHFFPSNEKFHRKDIVIIKFIDQGEEYVLGSRVGGHHKIEQPLRSEKQEKKSWGCGRIVYGFILGFIVLIVMLLFLL